MFKTRIIPLLILLLYVGNLYATDLVCVQESYFSQVGTREATGKNDGENVEQYLASTNLDKGYAWCASFVNWCLTSCHIPTKNSAWSPSWFPDSKVIYNRHTSKTETPRTGDVFGIYFSNKKRIAHMGFIHHWGKGSYVITVEGNTNDYGSREGDGVYVKRRHKRQIYKVARWE